MAISLTLAAQSHVRNFLAERGKPDGALRLGVKPTGCSGMSYVIEIADAARPDDAVFESYGIRVVVERKSLPYLDGTEIDYRREGLNAGFRFSNPNEKATCGCGESFSV
jgi:iron-sulfur cluster assembly protein